MSEQKVSPERMEAIRRAWAEARVVPLWEQGVHNAGREVPRGHHWRWAQIRPLIGEAIGITTMEQAERRVLCLANPDAKAGRNTTTNLNANFQVLMPGEKARPHRHTANALRFVVEGQGAITTVDGKQCPMQPGDLVITPGMSWHEHTHGGEGPMVWLDVLDVPLHQYLGTQRFEPGPSNNLPAVIADGAFVGAGVTPVPDGGQQRSYSPLFRYPKEAWTAALAAGPPQGDGSHRVRFTNPMTGGPAMPLMDCGIIGLAKARPTRRYRTSAHAVALVVSGEGTSQVGEQSFGWSQSDVFTMPHENWISHEARSADAVLFVVSDREVLDRLGLLIEEHG